MAGRFTPTRTSLPPPPKRRWSYALEDPVEVVVGWHDRNHPDPWWFCPHELCNAIRGRHDQ